MAPMTEDSSSIRLQIERFLIVGLLNNLINYSIFTLTLYSDLFDEVSSSVMGFLGGALSSYLLSFYWTFRLRHEHSPYILVRFTACQLITLWVHMTLFSYLFEGHAYGVQIAHPISMTIVVLINFMLLKFFVFH